MKHLKTFETITDEANKGDYALFKLYYYDVNTNIGVDDINIFINNTVGKIIKVYKEQKRFRSPRTYVVKYENIPENLKIYFNDDDTINIYHENLVLFAKTKEEAEIMMKANKYNI